MEISELPCCYYDFQSQKCHSHKTTKKSPLSPPIMLTNEPGMINKFWARTPVSYKYMSLGVHS